MYFCQLGNGCQQPFTWGSILNLFKANYLALIQQLANIMQAIGFKNSSRYLQPLSCPSVLVCTVPDISLCKDVSVSWVDQAERFIEDGDPVSKRRIWTGHFSFEPGSSVGQTQYGNHLHHAAF